MSMWHDPTKIYHSLCSHQQGPNSLFSCSTGQPRSSVSLSFGVGDITIATFLEIMLISEPPRDLVKCRKSCSSLFVRKGTSLLAKLLLTQSKSLNWRFSLSQCVGISGSHWPNGDIYLARRHTAYKTVRQSSIKRSDWPTHLIDTN